MDDNLTYNQACLYFGQLCDDADFNVPDWKYERGCNLIGREYHETKKPYKECADKIFEDMRQENLAYRLSKFGNVQS